MNKEKISLILLAIFLMTTVLTAASMFMDNTNGMVNETGSLNITDSKTKETRTVHYESKGKCLEVIDGDTIRVYGVGKVRLVQVDAPEKTSPDFTDSKKFVEEKCLGKTVYLDIDDAEPEDKYGRHLAVVYTDTEDVNRELLNNGLAETLFIPPSEFPEGQV